MQRRASVRVYMTADGADGESQMFYLVILRNMGINSFHICLRLLCRLLHKTVKR